MTGIINSPAPLVAVCVSLAAVVLIMLSGRHPNLREFWTLSAAGIKFIVVLSMLPVVLEGGVIEYTVINVARGLDIKFRVDALGIFFAITASFLWIVTSFYSIGYVRSLKEHAQTRYFAFFAVALSATIGVAFSANMFTAFIFYEIITLSTFPLVAHKETPEAMAGGRKYLVYLLGTSIGFQLFAIALTYMGAGTLEFMEGGIFGKATGLSGAFVAAVFVLYMAGIAKAAMMPLHGWLPAAMVAPTPVSALLHAVAVVKTGVFMVVRVSLHVFGTGVLGELGLGTVLAWVASITIITASVFALRQDNLKLRLAYSTISQLSYVVLGVALLSTSAITGSVMHILVHAFGKITLFFTAGAIYVASRKTLVSELDGIGRRMPFTMGAFTIAALSMIGVPPLGGFLSKWFIGLGAVEAGELPILIVIAASTILNASYFLPIVYAAFFKEPRDGQSGERNEAPAMMVVPLMITATATLAVFFYPSVFLRLARLVAGAATAGSI